MDLPHFGAEQPGETYYYSPFKINFFGSVDFATNKLDAFIYSEAEGKKGETMSHLYYSRNSKMMEL